MHWRDIDEGGWEGIAVELTAGDVPRRPPWNVDVARPGCVRLTAGDVPRWWGRIARGWGDIGMLRGEAMTPGDAVVRAMTAAEVRAVTDAPGSVGWWRAWARWFAEAMVASGRSPLRPGTWCLTPATCDDVPGVAVAGRPTRPVPSQRWRLARGRIERALGEQWTADLFVENTFSHGSGALLPLRRASAEDSGRVKAWRKQARDGTLPPVLVYFAAALDVFVLLDGHDRFAAARAEGAPVPWLLASAVAMETYPVDEGKRAGIARQVERLMTLDPPVPVATLNAVYAQAFDDGPWPRRLCYGRALAGGALAFGREVQRRLAELGLETEERWLMPRD